MRQQDRHIETHTFDWRGYEVAVTFERNWLGRESRALIGAIAHVTLHERERRALPVTETGFRSIFTTPDAVDAAGGPVAFVRDGLNEAAKSTAWRADAAARRQLSLF